MVDPKPNSTRFDIERDPRNPVDHLPTGYEGSSPSDGYTIPPCELEDVDVALHALFDERIGFRNTVIPDGENGPQNIGDALINLFLEKNTQKLPIFSILEEPLLKLL
jgi:hypothetical protein